MSESERPEPFPTQTALIHGDAGLDADSSVAPPIHPSVTYRGDSAEAFRAMARYPGTAGFMRVTVAQRCTSRPSWQRSRAANPPAACFWHGAISRCPCAGKDRRSRDRATLALHGHTQLVSRVLAQFGVGATIVEQGDLGAFEAAITPQTRLILVESPSNPLLQLTDLAAVAKIARARGITTLADNTFATPINTRPLTLGIDLVVHSATKFLGGHHDLLAGVVVGQRAAIERIWELSIVLGGNLGSFEAWLLLRGLRTLALRVERQNATALALARFLDSHPAVTQVHYLAEATSAHARKRVLRWRNVVRHAQR
jgi:cystathionine beta-lyase/cystathionine gamma-synthase